jgi:hypothetical protein
MPSGQSLVAQWNDDMLEAIRDGGAKPTSTTYQLHLQSAAVYDAFVAFDPDAYGSDSENGFADTTGFTPVKSPDPDAANAPGGVDFDPNSWQSLRVPNGTIVNDDGIPISDNDDASTYSDQIAVAPHWGSVTSFALGADLSHFRPAPPAVGRFQRVC